ncbi:hypothetical protein JG688_00000149, partial [Phytophthora aleatoria]
RKSLHPSARNKGRHKKASQRCKSTQSSPQRKRSSGTVKENEFKKDKGYCRFVCRLGTICQDLLLREEIQRSAHAMKQIQME